MVKNNITAELLLFKTLKGAAFGYKLKEIAARAKFQCQGDSLSPQDSISSLKGCLKNKSHPQVTFNVNGAGSMKAYSSRDSTRIAKTYILTLQR